MYLEPKVEKIIALDSDWSRVILPSSEEEMHLFITEEKRPDFEDNDILAIKFVVSQCEEAEETSWYFNPSYESAPNFRTELAAEYIPEVIFLRSRKDVLLAYQSFYDQLMADNADTSPRSIYNEFLEFLRTY